MTSRCILALCALCLTLAASACDGDPSCASDRCGADAGLLADSAPAAQLRVLGRGINLGNMLEAPVEGEWGATVKQHYLPAIRAAGFDAVRLPVRWSAHAESAPPFAIDPAFADRVDEVIGWALDADLAIVLNVHHYVDLDDDTAGHRARLVGLWRQIAVRHQRQPARLMFELLNEPHGQLQAPQWNDLLAETLAAVRESNPRRTVIVGPVSYNAIDELGSLELPPDDNLIVTVHFYSPFWFTHSGASWVGDPPAAGAVWDGTDEQQRELRQQLQLAAEWARDHAASIYVGEFGAYSLADQTSRVRWTRFVVDEMARLGFAWAYWEFCAGFGAYDPEAETWRDDLLAALIR